MSFARADRGLLPSAKPAKPTGGQKLSEGADELKRRADQINRSPKVIAAKDATKKGVKQLGDTVAGLFGLGDKSEQHQGQPLMGGKRRRKSRRKKRTKRRRKSRRKKRRTKRRRKSRRKRRR